jgi:hypothetical protein
VIIDWEADMGRGGGAAIEQPVRDAMAGCYRGAVVTILDRPAMATGPAST